MPSARPTGSGELPLRLAGQRLHPRSAGRHATTIGDIWSSSRASAPSRAPKRMVGRGRDRASRPRSPSRPGPRRAAAPPRSPAGSSCPAPEPRPRIAVRPAAGTLRRARAAASSCGRARRGRRSGSGGQRTTHDVEVQPVVGRVAPQRRPRGPARTSPGSRASTCPLPRAGSPAAPPPPPTPRGTRRPFRPIVPIAPTTAITAIEARENGHRLPSRVLAARRGPRAVRLPRDRHAADRRRPRRGRPRRGRRRAHLHRLRRRPRLPEHGPRLPARGRRDARADRHATCTSASWSGSTSPTSRSAAGSPSCRRARARPEEPPPQLGRRGRRERGQDRPRRDRPARVIVFDNAFHGRTLLTMTMTSKVKPTSAGSARSRPRSTARPRPTRTAASRPTTRSPGSRQLFKREVDPPTVACVVLEPVQGEGGFIPMPDDFPPLCASSATSTGSSTSTTRCRPASAAPARLGDRALRRRAGPPRLRQVARRRPAARRRHRPRRGHGRAGARRARRDLRRQPGRLRGGDRRARRGRAPTSSAPLRGARRADPGPPRRDRRRGSSRSARCAASGRCSRSSSSRDRETRSRRADLTKRTTEAPASAA